MSFNLNAFRQAKFEPRQDVVPLPELIDFFPEGTKPKDATFTIQMLSSNDLHRAENAIPAGNAAQELLKRLAGGADQDKAEVAAEVLGIIGGDDIEATLKKQLEMVRIGVVAPALQLQDVVTIAEHFPVAFKKLWLEISRLTGMGAAAVVKRRPSGKGKTSETP